MGQLALDIHSEASARIPAAPPASPADLVDGADLLAVFATVETAVAALELVQRGARILHTAGVPDNTGDGENGDLAINLATTDLYAKSGGVWTGLGFQLKGDKGDPGAGAAGKSAYELAVQQGFSGTLNQWLASLGVAGAAGKSAYQVAVDGGFVGNPAAWLASLKVKGDPGAAGSSLRWESFAPTAEAGQVGDMWVHTISAGKYALYKCTGPTTWGLRFTSPDPATGGSGGSGTPYTLPQATDAVLGGIKLGDGLTFNQVTGRVDAQPGLHTVDTGTVVDFRVERPVTKIENTTFTVDVAGAVAGVIQRVVLGATASAPALPSSFKKTGQFVAGFDNEYVMVTEADGTFTTLIGQLT